VTYSKEEDVQNVVRQWPAQLARKLPPSRSKMWKFHAVYNHNHSQRCQRCFFQSNQNLF